MKLFANHFEVADCEFSNEPHDEELAAKANALLRSEEWLQLEEFPLIDKLIRASLAISPKDGVPTITPFLFNSHHPSHVFQELASYINTHKTAAEVNALLGDEASAVLSIVLQPSKWPIGFFACQGELVPWIPSLCVLDQCLHLPSAVTKALNSRQADRWHKEKPGRLIVTPDVSVWRKRCDDHELDEQLDSWIRQTDCMVVTFCLNDKAKSFLIAEPFL